MTVTATSVLIRGTPPFLNPAIAFYEAYVQGGSPLQKCTMNATFDPLQCEIINLESATSYTVSLHACMPDAAGCGAAIQAETATTPLGK